jgi:hypothetical protein
VFFVVVVAVFSAGHLHTGLHQWIGSYGLVSIETRTPRATIDRIETSLSIAALSPMDGFTIS